MIPVIVGGGGYFLVMVGILPNDCRSGSLFVCDSGLLVYLCMGERKNWPRWYRGCPISGYRVPMLAIPIVNDLMRVEQTIRVLLDNSVVPIHMCPRISRSSCLPWLRCSSDINQVAISTSATDACGSLSWLPIAEIVVKFGGHWRSITPPTGTSRFCTSD